MQLLLCSDGLTEEVDDRGISQVLAHTECSAQECVDGLVAAAPDGGGSDNVTVVLVRRHGFPVGTPSGGTSVRDRNTAAQGNMVSVRYEDGGCRVVQTKQ